MQLTQQARVIKRVEAHIYKESASLIVRGAVHNSLLSRSARALSEQSARLEQPRNATRQVRFLATLLRLLIRPSIIRGS